MDRRLVSALMLAAGIGCLPSLPDQECYADDGCPEGQMCIDGVCQGSTAQGFDAGGSAERDATTASPRPQPGFDARPASDASAPFDGGVFTGGADASMPMGNEDASGMPPPPPADSGMPPPEDAGMPPPPPPPDSGAAPDAKPSPPPDSGEVQDSGEAPDKGALPDAAAPDAEPADGIV
jgi:hypothetical protein